MDGLALRYRPTTFDDLVGQRAVNVVLRAMVSQGKVPHALLFQGCRGTGKTTTARILTAAVNCEQSPGPCGMCPSCKSVFAGTSPELDERDAASHGLVEDIRALRHQIMYSVGGHCRFVVLDEAGSMSRAGFDALLKILEEPPPGTVFILATTEPGRIPETVLSRCMPFTFTKIAVADIIARLTHIADQEQIQVEPPLLAVLAERADGSLRDAVMSLDLMSLAGVHTVDQYARLTGDTDCGPRLLRALVTGDLAATFTVVTDILTSCGDARVLVAALTRTLRDLLVLRAGGTLLQQGTALADRVALADRIDTPTLFTAIRVLWDLTTKVRLGDDPAMVLDLAIVMLTDALAPSTPVVAPAPPRKLSLADMAAASR